MKKIKCKPTQRPLQRKAASLHLCILRNWSELATLRVYFVINYYTFLFPVCLRTTQADPNERLVLERRRTMFDRVHDDV